jgi:catalase
VIVKRDVLAGPQIEHLTSVIGDGHDVFPVNRQRVVRGHGRAGGIPQPYFRTCDPCVPICGKQGSFTSRIGARGSKLAAWVRTAYTLRAEDDDWGQAGTLVRDVMDDAERGRLVSNVAGHLRDGVTEEVLQHTFEYWKNIDKETGDKIEAAVRNGSS